MKEENSNNNDFILLKSRRSGGDRMLEWIKYMNSKEDSNRMSIQVQERLYNANLLKELLLKEQTRLGEKHLRRKLKTL